MNDTNQRRFYVCQMMKFDGITPEDFPYLFTDAVMDNHDGTYSITITKPDEKRTIVTKCKAAYYLQQLAIMRGQRKLIPRPLHNLPVGQMLGEFATNTYSAYACSTPEKLPRNQQYIDYDGHIYDRRALEIVAQRIGSDVRLEYVLDLLCK